MCVISVVPLMSVITVVTSMYCSLIALGYDIGKLLNISFGTSHDAAFRQNLVVLGSYKYPVCWGYMGHYSI